MNLWTWIAGAGFVFALGTWLPYVALKALRSKHGIPTRYDPVLPSVEQLFFLVLIAYDVDGAGTAMIGWIAAKLAAGWQRIEPEKSDGWSQAKTWQARKTALFGSLISLGIALVGGLIVRGDIPVADLFIQPPASVERAVPPLAATAPMTGSAARHAVDPEPWLIFLSSVVTGVAWPLTILIAVLVFRNKVGTFVDRLKTLEGPGGLKMMTGIAESVGITGVEPSGETSPTPKPRLTARHGREKSSAAFRAEMAVLAQSSPRAVVLQAWHYVMARGSTALKAKGMYTPPMTIGSVKEALLTLLPPVSQKMLEYLDESYVKVREGASVTADITDLIVEHAIMLGSQLSNITRRAIESKDGSQLRDVPKAKPPSASDS